MKVTAIIVCILTLFFIECRSVRNNDTAVSALSYELVKDWPQLPANYILGNPTGIGIDSKQNIFVFIRAGRNWTDPMPDSVITSRTILEIDRNSGKIIDSWGDHLFIMPHGLTVDQDDNIWVTDVGLQQVFKFSHDGKLLMGLGEARVAGTDSVHFNLPTDVAVAADHSFYVSDGYGNNRVIKFSASGKYLFEWGKKGDKAGEFNLPHAIDLDAKGNVYVADRENSRIQSFTADGKFLKEWSNRDSGCIYSVTLDRTNNSMIAVDYLKTNDTVVKGSDVIVFNPIGKSRVRFGRSGGYQLPVCRFHDIAVDNEENIYVGDIRNNAILKFKKRKQGGQNE